MTEDMGNGEGSRRAKSSNSPADSARSTHSHPAVGQPAGNIGHHRPIPEQITNAAAHCAEPVDLCLVLRKRRPCSPTRTKTRDSEIVGETNAVFFPRALNVGLKPRDPNGRELPIVADLTTTDDSSGFNLRGGP